MTGSRRRGGRTVAGEVLVGAEIQPTEFRKTGLLFVVDPGCAADRAREIASQGLGNFVAVRVPSLMAGAGCASSNLTGGGLTVGVGSPVARYVEICHELGLKVMLIYGAYTPAALQELRTRWPGTVIGVEIGEILGHLGGPGANDSPDMAEGRKLALERLSRSVRSVKSTDPRMPVVSTDGTCLHHLSAEAGCDLNMTELFVGNCEVHLSAVRGAARAAGDRAFGSYMAAGWYGGSNADPDKIHRFRLGLQASYMHGAGVILNESGTWGSYEFGDSPDPDGDLAVAERDTLRRFYAFVRRDRRPSRGPEVSAAFLQGHLDGWTGHTQTTLWASSSIRCVPDSPERGWDLLDVAYPEFGGCDSTPAEVHGAQWFSAAPYGAVDLVPASAGVAALSRYRGVVCVGWNTMRPALWKRLAAYVRGGGSLLISAVHLTLETDHGKVMAGWPPNDFRFLKPDAYEAALGLRVLGRKEETQGGAHYGRRAKLLRVTQPVGSALPQGREWLVHYPIPVADLKLCGARPVVVSDRGDPILLRHKHGKGEFWFFAGWCYPGYRGIRPFARDVVTSFLEKNRGPVQVESRRPIDWTCYRIPGGWKAYLLNTDLERGGSVSVTARGVSRLVRLRPGGFRVVQLAGGRSAAARGGP